VNFVKKKGRQCLEQGVIQQIQTSDQVSLYKMYAVVLSSFVGIKVRRFLGIFIKDPWYLSRTTQKQDKRGIIDGES